jgi:hypothetical protein
MSGFSTVAHSSAAIIPFLGGEQPAYLSTPSRDREAAGRFLHLLDPAARDFTFQAFDERGVDASLARNTSDRAEIVRLYEQGAGVYVTVNETNLIGRKSENIKRVRAIWQEDDEGHGGPFPLEPSLVIETSPAHFHRYWLVVDDWPANEQGRADFAAVMERMVSSYGCDHRAKDLCRVLRVPGFLHRKDPMQPHMVRIMEASGRRYTREQILRAFPPIERETYSTTSEWRPADCEETRVIDALRAIPAHDRDVWLQIGMALRDELGDCGRLIWDNWSATCPEKFRDRDQDRTWRSFRRNGIGIGTLFYHAERHGWSPPRRDTAGTELVGLQSSSELEPKAGSNNQRQPNVGSLANFVFVSDEIPSPQKMLIEGVMPLEGLPFIGGQSSAGKTFIAILIAVCAASGSPLFGREEVKERLGSVIVAAEGKGMLRARIAAAMKELGIEGDIPVAWVKQVPDFNRADGLQAFVRDLRAISEHFKTSFGVRLGLVFVDTVSASFDIKEEADNAEAARVCKVMRRIGDAITALVVPIHHYGKNASVGLRGASAWRANADFVLSVMADIDPQTGNVTNRQLAVAKDRDGAQGPLTSFTLKPVELGTDESGRPWGSMVAVAEAGAAKPASDWPPSLSVFRQALHTALADGAFEDQPFADGPILRVVFHDLVRDEFAKITHVDSASEDKRQEAIRKQFARRLNDAQSKKLIGVRARSDGKTLVWLVSRQESPQ